MGCLLSSIAFFTPAFNIEPFVDDAKFWLSWTGIALAFPLVTISFTKRASIFSCVIVGAFAVIVPIDHYTGGHIKYIMMNIVRRATVDGFNWAVIYAPFQVCAQTINSMNTSDVHFNPYLCRQLTLPCLWLGLASRWSP